MSFLWRCETCLEMHPKWEKCSCEIKKDYANAKARIAALEAEVEQANGKIYQLKGDCAAYFNSIESLKAEVEQLRGALEDLEDRFEPTSIIGEIISNALAGKEVK